MAFEIPSYRGPDDPRWAFLPDQPYRMLVNGALVDGAATEPIVSPRDRRTIAEVSVPDAAQIDDIVSSANAALTDGPWATWSGIERGRALLRLAEAIEANADELAFLDAVDVGKPVSTSYSNDLVVSLDALSYFAGRASDINGGSADLGTADVFHRTRIEPIGVVLEVLPWNGPLWTGVQRLAAILAAGNTAIMKPAELGAASWMRLAQLLTEVGLPDGVVSVVPGQGETIGAALVHHPGVDLVSLTGGIDTGARVLADTASQLKRVSLELGGKNPNIVCADADLDNAVFWSGLGAFANTGQVCVCGSRILVERPIYDAFVEGLAGVADSMRVGDPLEPETQLGPLVGAEQYEKVWRYLDKYADGSDDARLVTGGQRYTDAERTGGWYAPPTVFADASPSCDLAREEIFGPVVTVTPFDELSEALAIANDTRYGLASGVFTRDVAKAARVAHALQAGQVYVNQWFSPGVLQAPAQGYKQSGLGGVGMEKYQQTKQIFTRIA